MQVFHAARLAVEPYHAHVVERDLGVEVEARIGQAAAGRRLLGEHEAGEAAVIGIAGVGERELVARVVGEMGNAGQAAYSASKAALIGLTKTLAREYASRNITVNAVAPGYIETDMTAAFTAEQREGVMKGIPLGRCGRPEEVAAAIAFLCSDEAAYITAQVLRVNGGMYV